MTKADIVNKIHKDTGIDREDALKVVESFMDNVKSALIGGENVYLRGFGSFIVKERAAKMARNITKQITIQIPKRKVPAFKPSKLFSAEVK
ncbi:HU family DNA-binding protein [Falsiporphyromonas endometrii]|uniref:HU family DNA-binding protein n=1 Tax=Falsiporphyromonas endometrii TaxID=1387297 RepID=A0ABV9K755_9PORP|nr:HU family DNA-binding protein [Porphyromonadaceae bacterium]